MKKILLLFTTFFFCFETFATDNIEGIHFYKGTWAETVAKAKTEKKLIFIDFYTQWCGPCMNMAIEVFTSPTVGYFYNSNFINAKIDAEVGEGKTLANKFGVRSYPTYLFINPNTQEVVHRSGSTQTVNTFIFTGQCALNPNMRSFYMESEYAKGSTDRTLLKNYVRYAQSIYKRENAEAAFNKLINGGAKLTDPDIWVLFVDYIQGLSPYLQKVSDNYTAFCNLYGKSAVDEKLAKETMYGDKSRIAAMCDFAGKSFNLKMIEVDNLDRKKDYEALGKMIDELIADPTINQNELCSRMKFIFRARSITEVPQAWAKKILEYIQYIAYNYEDRRDAYIHQEYAAALEAILRSVPADQWANYLPESVLKAPQKGKQEYSMRPSMLKMKPTVSKYKK